MNFLFEEVEGGGSPWKQVPMFSSSLPTVRNEMVRVKHHQQVAHKKWKSHLSQNRFGHIPQGILRFNTDSFVRKGEKNNFPQCTAVKKSREWVQSEGADFSHMQ